ncbi:MAG: hypothetical protein IJZ19_08610 [Lentisphaeria bacterium]|nr:hypothetical protein [Lentisphaeria bacterium]
MNDFFDEEMPRTVAQRKAWAAKLAADYAAENGPLTPAVPHGRNICKHFWGKAWCRNVERYQEYESRLPAGRSYLKNDAVIDLKISPGLLQAVVVGQEVYQVKITIDPLNDEKKQRLLEKCAGKISSLADLIAGELSEELLGIFCDEEDGLFPAPDEIRFDCNCTDWSEPCKHAAAVLYGTGARLDDEPELFFVLRGISTDEFFSENISDALPSVPLELDEQQISAIFDIKLN